MPPPRYTSVERRSHTGTPWRSRARLSRVAQAWSHWSVCEAHRDETRRKAEGRPDGRPSSPHAAAGPLVPPQDSDHDALDLHVVLVDVDRIHRRVGGLE